MSKAEKAKRGMDTTSTFSLHVLTTADRVREVRAFIDAALRHESFTNACALTTHLVSRFKGSSYGPVEKAKLKQVISRQKYVQDRIWTTSIPGAIALDVPNSEKVTLRTAVMRLTLEGKSTSIYTDASFDSRSIDSMLSFSEHHKTQGTFVANNLAAYLYHSYGDPALEWFTPDMQQVKTLGWDEENNRPITEDSC